jgi:Ca2+-binding RTX toxin-like protein/GH24 family phage-related lysozyme (muramidase)
MSSNIITRPTSNLASDLKTVLTNEEGDVPTVYPDSVGIPTIGIGVNLTDKVNMDLTLQTMLSASVAPTVLETFAATAKFSWNIKGVLYTLDAQGNQVALQSELNTLLADYGWPNTTFTLSNTQSDTLFSLLSQSKVTSLQTLLANNHVGIGQNTLEFAALASLYYNQTASNPLIATGTTLLKALQNGNRAQAWFQIRYRSNGGQSASAGIAKRRYYESQLFGLSSSGDSLPQAKQNYEMLTENRSRIISYEEAYGEAPGQPASPTDEVAKANSGFGLSPNPPPVPGLDPEISQSVQNLVQTFYPDGLVIQNELNGTYGSVLPGIVVTADLSTPQSGNSFNVLATDVYVAPTQDDIDNGFATSAQKTVVAGTDRGMTSAGLQAFANHVLIGSGDGDVLIGGQGRDILVAGSGSERLEVLPTHVGSDTLIGGAGNDTLVGGTTTGAGDVFDFQLDPSTNFRDSVVENSVEGLDSLEVNGTQIGSGLVLQADGTWLDGQGTHYQFESLQDALASTNVPLSGAPAGLVSSGSPYSGVLKITGGSVGDNEIDIWGFDLQKAVNSAFDGISIPKAIVLTTGASVANVLGSSASGGATSAATNLAASDSVSVTATLLAPSTSDETITFTLSGPDTSGFSLGYEGQLLPFADGSVDIPITAGTESVTATLVSTSSLGTDESLHLTATASDPATSAPLAINYIAAAEDPFSQSQSSGLFYAGPESVGSGVTTSYGQTYNLYFANGGNGSSPPPQVSAAAPGNNYIDATSGGGIPNDSIDGGSGNDTITADFAFDNGDGGVNVINGHGGRDVILLDSIESTVNGANGEQSFDGSNYSARVYADSQVDLATAISHANTLPASGQPGDLIASFAQNATIVGGEGNDLILDDSRGVVVAGSGDDTIVGGAGIEATTANWFPGPTTLDYSTYAGVSWSATVTNNQLDVSGGSLVFVGNGAVPGAGYEGNTGSDGTVLGSVSETIFGGAGDSVFLLSNGNNEVTLGKGDSTVYGGMGNNTIFGGEGSNLIEGGGGSDYIAAGMGNDVLYGRGGNNTLIGGAGSDTLVAGNAGSDFATSETGSNYVHAGSGNTLIFGAGGSDTLIGGSGDDTIEAGAGNEFVVGGAGNESINGGAGSDTLEAGGSGNDTIWAGSGNTTIYGGGGVDHLHGGSGSDVIYAGDGGVAGDPTLIYAGDGNTTIYGGGGVDNITGGSGADVIYAGDGGTAAAPTQIEAGAGDTTIYGGAGVDEIFGGSGTDVLYAGDGGTDANPNFVTAGTGTATLYGGAGASILRDDSGGADVLVAGSGDANLYGTGNDTLVAGSGSDYLSGSGSNTYEFDSLVGDDEIANLGGSGEIQFSSDVSSSDVTFSADIGASGGGVLLVGDGGRSIRVDGGLGAGAISSVSFAGSSMSLVQAVQQAASTGNADGTVVSGSTGNLIFDVANGDSVGGGSGQDTISAWGNNDSLTAGAGGDLIYAQGSEDIIQGGAGNDTLDALGANTTLIGGTGNELFKVNDASEVVSVDAGGGSDSIVSSVSYTLPTNVDTLTLSGNADLSATGNDDVANLITGNSGDDWLVAGSGSDTLVSGIGIDTLVGGSGADTFDINNSGDVVQTPYYNGYQDTINSSVDYFLVAPVYTLTLTGSADLTGTDSFGYATVTGNAGNDTLIGGNNGFDELVAGSGIDTLIGRNGRTTFVINNAADVVEIQGSQLYDTVESSVSYVLGNQLDYLQLIGSDDLVGQGNDDASNQITGNSGNDTLIAGSGNDTLVAGSGTDTLIAGSGADLLKGNASDTFVLGSNVTSSEITVSSGSAAIEFGPGVTAADLTLGMTFGGNGDLALLIQDGSMAVTVDGGLTGSINQFDFSDGSQLSLEQLLKAGHTESATLVGGAGNAILDIDDSASITGGTGADTIIAAGSNDTITAGVGNQALYGLGEGDMIMGGVGDDTLHGGTNSSTLVAGTGNTIIYGGSGSNSYTLTRGGTTTINPNATSGTQTIYLPTGMTSADFTSYAGYNGDLILQSVSGDTTAIISGFYANTASSALWLLSDSSGGPQFLQQWAALPHQPSGETYEEQIDQLRQQYAARLGVVLNDIGAKGGTVGSPNGRSYADQYTFNGVSTQNIQVQGGQLNVGPSDTTSFDSTTTTLGYRTVSYNVPIYGTVTYPGSVDFVSINDPILNTLEDNEGLGSPVYVNGQLTGYNYITLPQTNVQQLGSRVVTETYAVTSTYTTSTQSMTAYNIVGDGGDDVITAAGPFVGTVKTGDGNVSVDLGTSGAGYFLDYRAPDQLPLGAFIEAGAGNDTISGTGGADTIAAGLGFDYLSGSLGADFYVPMEGDATEFVSDLDSLQYGDSSYQRSTLILPVGIAPSDLQYRLFEPVDYQKPDPSLVPFVELSGMQYLQLKYSDSSVIVPFWTGSPSAYLDNGNPGQPFSDPNASPGVNYFQFADGEVLTRSQLLALAGPAESMGDLNPVVIGLNPTLTAGTPVAAASLFSASDGAGNDTTWYQITDPGTGGGQFVLNGTVEASGQTFQVSADQLSGLLYVPGTSGVDDPVQVAAFDGVLWGQSTTIDLTATSSNQLSAAGPNQSIEGATVGSDTLVGGFGGDIPIDASSQDTFEHAHDSRGALRSEKSYTASTDGTYTDTWSKQDGTNGSYWWNASTREYQEDWHNDNGSAWTDSYHYSAGGSPAGGGGSFTESYGGGHETHGTRQSDATSGIANINWYSSAMGTVTGTDSGAGFIGMQINLDLTNTTPDPIFINSAMSPHFEVFPAAH